MDNVSSCRRLLDWTRDPPPRNLTPFQTFTRNVDWEKSPLGPMATWPSQLRQMVLLIVADPSPAVVYWGDEMTIVYNEAYTPLIGQKHPGLQGQDPKIGFAEIWPMFDKIIRDGQETGETHIGEKQMLLLHRYGFLEETYYSWKFVPMIGDEGYVVASYATVVEVTKEMIGNRRMASLQHMSLQLEAAKDMRGFWAHLLKGLESNDKDLPLVMLYSVEKDTSGETSPPRSERVECVLEGCMGVSEGHASAPSRIDLACEDPPGFATALKRSLIMTGPLLLGNEDASLPSGIFEGVEWRGFGVPSEEIIINPIRTSGGRLVGFMIMGLNPRRKFDFDYQTFIDLITKQVTTPYVSAILLAEEIRQGEDEAKSAALQRAELSSQLRQRTKEYERSEHRFARFADLASIGVATTDSEARLTYANSAWYEINQLQPDETKVLSILDLDTIIPDDKLLISEEWSRVLAGKLSDTFQMRFKKPFNAYSESHGHMKSPCTTGLCAAYPEKDEQGKLISTTALIMDISELKWNEDQVRLRSRELEQSELKYKNFADHAPIGVALMNVGGFVEYMNEAWFAITDQSRDNHNVRPWLKTVHLDDFDKTEAFFDDLVACKGPLTVEARLKRPRSINGQDAELDQDIWILASGYAEVNLDAKVLQIKMGEALERKRQQENFIDTISHEIRNPLSAVLHCAEAIESSLNEAISAMSIPASKSTQNLQQSKLSDALKNAADDAKTIAYCVQHQKGIVDDVLTLSKLDSKLLTISPTVVQPCKIVREALKLFEGELKAADMELQVEDDQPLHDLNVDWVLLDPSRLVQVLINLVTNAIKFTRNRARRQISVKISASSEMPTRTSTSVEYFPERVTEARRRDSTISKNDERRGDDIYLSLAVTDTGKGLSTKEKTRLFQRFAQGSTKTHAEYGGSGLGLFISRQITEMMGGEIGVASEEGEGSTFFFFIKTQHAAKPKDEADGETSVLLPSTAKPVPVAVDAELAAPLPLREAEFKANPSAAESLEPPNILIVEDNLVNQKVLSKQLSTRGYKVFVANNGAEALASLYKTASYEHGGTEPTFDIILMDVEMPQMDGSTCVRRTRSLEARGLLDGRRAIVAVTANVRDEHVSAAMDAGMDDLLQQMKKAYNSTR